MLDAFHMSLTVLKQEMCDKVVKDDPSSLQFVPDWVFTREWVDMWYDDY